VALLGEIIKEVGCGDLVVGMGVDVDALLTRRRTETEMNISD
jgi:hypothetical protein